MDPRALRDKLGIPREELAARIKVSQSQLSRLERRRDSRLSTIRRYVEGGELEITAVIRGRRVAHRASQAHQEARSIRWECGNTACLLQVVSSRLGQLTH
jgi:predicted transcriptional regulator